MQRQSFRLNLLRKVALLSVVFTDTTFVFGIDFIARILEFQIYDKTYVSRSHYEENLYRFENDEQYRGKIIEVPEKESDLAKILLTKKVKSHQVEVQIAMSRMGQALCRQCKGKGYTDWIEDIVQPKWTDHFTPDEINLTFAMLLKTYVQFDYYNNASAFYRNRNLKKGYMQECKVCRECCGVGFDDAFLQTYVPHPIVENIFTSVETYLEIACLYAEELPEHLWNLEQTTNGNSE